MISSTQGCRILRACIVKSVSARPPIFNGVVVRFKLFFVLGLAVADLAALVVAIFLSIFIP